MLGFDWCLVFVLICIAPLRLVWFGVSRLGCFAVIIGWVATRFCVCLLSVILGGWLVVAGWVFRFWVWFQVCGFRFADLRLGVLWVCFGLGLQFYLVVNMP